MTSSYREAVERQADFERMLEQRRRELNAWANAVLVSIMETPRDCAWFGPGIGRIETIVGYDPQKLLR